MTPHIDPDSRLGRDLADALAAARAASPPPPPVRIPVNRPDGPAAAQAALDAETRDWHAELMARSRERLDLAELTPAYTAHLERQAGHDGARIRALEAQLWRRDVALRLLYCCAALAAGAWVFWQATH